MTQQAQPTEAPDEQGWALKRLLLLHAGLRNDLTVLRHAVTAVTEDGQDVDSALAAIGDLSIRQGGFCQFMHEHHAVEDSVMLPSVVYRQVSPEEVGAPEPQRPKVL